MRFPNSIDSRKGVTERINWAGRQWYYPYREIPIITEDKVAEKRIQKVLQNYAAETRAWDDERNSDWVCRIYFATKLLMMATLQVNSLIYSEEHNLRVVQPHLRYYSLFSLCKAICFTLPELAWANGSLLTMTHERVIRHAVAYIQTFSKKAADAIEASCRLAKAQRELIDYNAPSSGDAQLTELNRFRETCRLLAEFAQLNSELLERSFEKHTNDIKFEMVEARLWVAFQVEIEGQNFFDEEDVRRIGYLARKHPRPTNIRMMLTDGHVEDFFGAWGEDETDAQNFDPDNHWDSIFDIS